MTVIEQSTEIDAPAGAVWNVLEDVRRLPSFSPSTVGVEAPARLTEAGQTFTQTVELAGRSFTSTWRVVTIDPPNQLVIEGSVLPGTRYRMTETVVAHGADRSEMKLRMDFHLPFGPLGRLASKLGAAQRAESEARTVLAGVRAAAEAA